MIWIALSLFAAAAVGGLIMALKIFGDEAPPMALALVHGAAAAAGLALLAWVVLQSQVGTAMQAALGILVVAALGGFFLFSFHLRGKAHPKAVVALHALLAVSGVVALVLGLL